ncbi:MAG: hypothetical protein ACU85V_00190 [Gammaproteobacteria bacterium]
MPERAIEKRRAMRGRCGTMTAREWAAELDIDPRTARNWARQMGEECKPGDLGRDARVPGRLLVAEPAEAEAWLRLTKVVDAAARQVIEN